MELKQLNLKYTEGDKEKMNIIRKEMEGIERNQMDFGGWNMISDIKISFEETNRLDIAGKKTSMNQKNS